VPLRRTYPWHAVLPRASFDDGSHRNAKVVKVITDEHRLALETTYLPADVLAVTGEMVRAEMIRADELRYRHRDEAAAARVQRNATLYVVRATAAGHPKARDLALAVLADR